MAGFEDSFLPELEQVVGQLERGTIITRFSSGKKSSKPEKMMLTIRRETMCVHWYKASSVAASAGECAQSQGQTSPLSQLENCNLQRYIYYNLHLLTVTGPAYYCQMITQNKLPLTFTTLVAIILVKSSALPHLSFDFPRVYTIVVIDNHYNLITYSRNCTAIMFIQLQITFLLQLTFLE